MITGLCQGQGVDGNGKRLRPLDGLLDEQRGRDQTLERGRLPHPAPQLGDAFGIVILLIAVQGGSIGTRITVEHGGDPSEAVEIRLHVAGNLQLVVAGAIVAHDFLKGLGQAIANPILCGLVPSHDRVEEADRVAHVDRATRAQAAQEARQVVASKIGRQLGCGLDAGRVAGDQVGEGQSRRTPHGIEDGAVEQRRPIAGDQRHEPQRGAACQLVGIGAGKQAERRAPRLLRVEIDGKPHGLAQLIHILGIAEGRALVEPLGGEVLRSDPCRGAPVLQGDGGAHNGLRALGYGYHSEPEGQAQPEIALEALDPFKSDLGRRAHLGHRSRIALLQCAKPMAAANP